MTYKGHTHEAYMVTTGPLPRRLLLPSLSPCIYDLSHERDDPFGLLPQRPCHGRLREGARRHRHGLRESSRGVSHLHTCIHAYMTHTHAHTLTFIHTRHACLRVVGVWRERQRLRHHVFEERQCLERLRHVRHVRHTYAFYAVHAWCISLCL